MLDKLRWAESRGRDLGELGKLPFWAGGQPEPARLLQFWADVETYGSLYFSENP